MDIGIFLEVDYSIHMYYIISLLFLNGLLEVLNISRSFVIQFVFCFDKVSTTALQS